jgi:hypothetical protein
MILKKFLKPDWRKIVIALIIFNLMPAFIDCWFCPPHALCSIPPPPKLEFFGFPKCLLCIFNHTREMFGGWSYRICGPYLQYFILAIISYFISSFLIWIYDKVKKKHKGRSAIVLAILILIILITVFWLFGIDCNTKCFLSFFYMRLGEIQGRVVGKCRESREWCYYFVGKSKDCPQGCCCFFMLIGE